MNLRLSLLLQIWKLAHFPCFLKAYSPISDESLKAIPRPGEDFDIKTGKILAPILIPRVPGTEGQATVLNHLVSFFKTELPQWDVEIQNSTSKTPVTGNDDIPFHNVIVTRDPPGTSPGEVGYLTLVAHWDSKRTPEGFIGAIDSAAPVAMLMHTARALDTAMTKKWAAINELGIKQDDFDLGLQEHKGLQLLLLDGEEAFAVWSKEDSIYGAKALAEEMETTFHPALSTYHNALASIDLFVLLDLLGSVLGEGNPNSRMPSYYKTTHWAYKSLATLETRLRDRSLFASSPNHPSKRLMSSESKERRSKQKEPTWFFDVDKSSDRWMGGFIEDDHLPFIARGVEILHLIPSPFPLVWHESSDDGEHLDMDTCGDWAVLMTAFAAEWMELEGYLDTKLKSKRAADKEEVVSKSEL